jgi:membrane-associated protein
MDFDITALIKSLGYTGVFAAVFAESGLLVGMFLPGDSLLFTAGFLASQSVLNFPLLLVVTFVAAVAGDTTGYITGKRYGHKVFKKDDALFLNKKHIERSEAFYAKHGGKTLILARFTPVVRTIAPILAGVGKMTYRKFFVFNLIGAFLWAVGVTSLGYFLGSVIPDVERYIIPGVIIIVAVSIIPSMLHFLRDVENRNKIKAAASSVRRKKQ